MSFLFAFSAAAADADAIPSPLASFFSIATTAVVDSPAATFSAVAGGAGAAADDATNFDSSLGLAPPKMELCDADADDDDGGIAAVPAPPPSSGFVRARSLSDGRPPLDVGAPPPLTPDWLPDKRDGLPPPAVPPCPPALPWRLRPGRSSH